MLRFIHVITHLHNNLNIGQIYSTNIITKNREGM